MKQLHFISLLYLSSKVYCEFIPTNEWQVVAPDEQIPPGLHVRLNFDTGVREAKLLDPEDDRDSDIIVAIPEEAEVDIEDKKIPIDNSQQLPSLNPSDPHHSHLNEGIKNIKSQLTLQYDLLEKMAELAHDIEYGTIIINSALPELIAITLNRNDHSIEFRDTAARALGASLRNNPQSLNILFDSKTPIIEKLLKGLEIENESKIESRLLYVLSACLDDNRGRKDFIKSNGGDVIRKVFIKHSNPSPDSFKIQRKCCDIIDDHIITTKDENQKWKQNEVEKWGKLLQQTLIKDNLKYNAETKYSIFKSLVNIKENTPSISITDKFISWISKENDLRLRIKSEKETLQSGSTTNSDSDSDSDYQSIEEQYFDEIKRTRHLLFGNPKAQRKHLADDL